MPDMHISKREIGSYKKTGQVSILLVLFFYTIIII